MSHTFTPIIKAMQQLIAGALPRRQSRLVEAWAELHAVELLANWHRLQRGQLPLRIAPLL